MTTLTFYFAVPISTNANTSTPSASYDCQNYVTPTSNETLSSQCGTGSYAYYNYSNTTCSSQYTITSQGGVSYCCVPPNKASSCGSSGGGCGGSVCCSDTHTCASSNSSGSGCANYTLPFGTNIAYTNQGYFCSAANKPAISCTLNYTCLKPNTSYYVTSPSPSSGPTFSSFYYASGSTSASTSTPNYAVFSVNYSLSGFTTTSQVESAINTFFGTNITNLNNAQNVTSGGSLAAVNITSMKSILNSFCASSSTNLSSAPCNQYCGFSSGNLASSITNSIANCTPAYATYCNNSIAFSTTPCTNYYDYQMKNGQTTYQQILQSQCDNSDYYIEPTSSATNALYTFSDSMPSICYCYVPDYVLQNFYSAVNAAYGYTSISTCGSVATCCYSPCLVNNVALNYGVSKTCPSIINQNCIDNLYITGSSLGENNVINQSNNCQLNSSTGTNNSSSVVSIVGTSAPSSTTTVLSSSSTSSPSSSTKKILLIVLIVIIILIIVGGGLYYWYSMKQGKQGKQTTGQQGTQGTQGTQIQMTTNPAGKQATGQQGKTQRITNSAGQQ